MLGDVDADVRAEPVDDGDALANALADEHSEGAAEVLGRVDRLLHAVGSILAETDALEETEGVA